MSESPMLDAVAFLALLLPVGFWGRGLVRRNRGDLALAVCLLIVVSGVSGWALQSIPFPLFSPVVIAMGIETLVFGKNVMSGGRWDRLVLWLLGLGWIGLGVLFALML